MPCDILFVGEAPGRSEDVIGNPFVGPAGHEMDTIVRKALANFDPVDYDEKKCHAVFHLPEIKMSPIHLFWAFTNLVACIPLDEGRRKLQEPRDEHVIACKPRLQEFVNRIAQPKLIVCVGSIARDWLDWKTRGYVRFEQEIHQIHVVHPAHILRAKDIQQEPMRKWAMVTIRDAMEKLLCR